MKVIVTGALLFILFILSIFSISCAAAQEVNDQQAIPPQRPPWEVNLGAAWLPESRLRGADQELGMREAKLALTRRFIAGPRLEFSTGLSYTLRDLDAPQSARLPDSLHTVALQLGAERRYSDRLTLGIRVTPGFSSDFAGSGDDFRLSLGVQAKYQVKSTLSTVTGIAYNAQSHSLPVLPILGVSYLPSDAWSFSLGFPRSAAAYRTQAGTGLSLAGELSGGEYGVHDREIGARVLRYRDFRALLGVELPIGRTQLALSGGYAFGRRISFYEGEREDLKLDNAPVARIEVKQRW